MATLDLLGQDYPSRALDQNQSTLINMYLEGDQNKGKFKVIALPTPGLTTFSDTGQANVRALFEHNNVLYAVAGNKFYSINSGGTATQIGSNLSTSSGFAKIEAITGGGDNNNQLIIIDGTNGYHYNIGTNTATFPIADADFPQTCTDLAAQDDYVIVQDNNSISFNISSIADGTTWSALDFASKIGKADRLVALFINQRKLYLMGSKTTEVWYNSGNNNFPFERVPDIFLHYGCAARSSVYLGDQNVYFLGRTANGGFSVVKIDQYSIIPVSTQPLDTEIGTLTSQSDAIGYVYKKDGHEFYELTFPTDGKTYTYDITANVWFRRQSLVSASYTRFLGNCAAFCYNKHLVGDYNSGKIYYQNTTGYTENSVAIRRRFVTPAIYYEGKRVIVDRLSIVVETGIGSNKTFTLEKSLDNGSTWTTVNTYTVPDKGRQIYENRLGSSKTGILFRITTTMDAKFIILGFEAQISVGHDN